MRSQGIMSIQILKKLFYAPILRSLVATAEFIQKILSAKLVTISEKFHQA